MSYGTAQWRWLGGVLGWAVTVTLSPRGLCQAASVFLRDPTGHVHCRWWLWCCTVFHRHHCC